jgi:RNA polymerase sigma-70 factor, ECF subfamily
MLYTDGGGKRRAALNPIAGAQKIARFFSGIVGKTPELDAWRVKPAHINGLPGFIYVEPDGALQTAAFDIRDGRIAAIYVVVNPEKLARVAF